MLQGHLHPLQAGRLHHPALVHLAEPQPGRLAGLLPEALLAPLPGRLRARPGQAGRLPGLPAGRLRLRQRLRQLRSLLSMGRR